MKDIPTAQQRYDEIQNDPGAHFSLQRALSEFWRLDPVDALWDAATLYSTLEQKARELHIVPHQMPPNPIDPVEDKTELVARWRRLEDKVDRQEEALDDLACAFSDLEGRVDELRNRDSTDKQPADETDEPYSGPYGTPGVGYAPAPPGGWPFGDLRETLPPRIDENDGQAKEAYIFDLMSSLIECSHDMAVPSRGYRSKPIHPVWAAAEQWCKQMRDAGLVRKLFLPDFKHF